MKIQVMSDLHLNFHRVPFRPECDDEANTVLVLAGDVIELLPGNQKQAIGFFSDCVARYKAVIFVTGNHEYYGTSWEGAHTERTDLEMAVFGATGKDLLVAEDYRVIQIDQQRFVCGTMWVPEPPAGTPNITDNQTIRKYKPEVFRRHQAFLKGLDADLKDTDIVVTHHMPSEESIAPEYYHSPYNAWFCAPKVESYILDRMPKLWIHGHTHVPFQYSLGPTRVICNPRGYERESAIGNEGLVFDPHLVIDI